MWFSADRVNLKKYVAKSQKVFLMSYCLHRIETKKSMDTIIFPYFKDGTIVKIPFEI